ncbi:MAG: PilT/PilU family type 4a pilus ATPase [Nitrospirae bacterium]|nr:PilT/PilU family type 4a pilus ATPase [Nitrospirota bacterium]
MSERECKVAPSFTGGGLSSGINPDATICVKPNKKNNRMDDLYVIISASQPAYESTMQEFTGRHRPRIGEMLLDYGFIDQDQLAKALDRQIRSGGRLGSVLEEMGYVDDDMLLSVLGRQHNVPHVNLFDMRVSPEILNILPFEKVRSFRVLPFRKTDDFVSLAMVDPYDINTIENIETAVSGAVRPFVASHYQMDRAIRNFEQEGYGGMLFDGDKLRSGAAIAGSKVPGISAFLKLVPDFMASELYLAAGASPAMKGNAGMKRLSMPKLTPAQMKDFIYEILSREQMAEFERRKELDFIYPVPDTGRFRISLFRQRNSISLSARLILEKIPSLNELGLPEWITGYAMKSYGLILVAGLPGSGKSSTVSALVDIINSNRSRSIVTLEDPVVYLHKHKMSNVNQREIGIDTESFATGLGNALMHGADVIVVSELRDAESMSLALNAAETGRLVISAMTTMNTLTAIDRIIDVFPVNRKPQIRMQLADTLLLAFAQKLVPSKEEGRKALAYEKLTGSVRVRNLIKDGKTSNIKALMQVVSEDMLSVDRSLARLCLDGKISFEEGFSLADSPAFYQDLIRTGSA